MAFKCPSCSVDIPGVMTQEAHLERLNAKTEENKELKSRLTEAQTAASKVGELQAERDRLAAEVTKRDRMAERSAAFEEVGVPGTPAVRKGFELVYDSEMSGAEQPMPFKDWLARDETKGHPLLSAHYAKPQGQQTQQGQGTQGQGGQTGQATGGNGATQTGATQTGVANGQGQAGSGAIANGQNQQGQRTAVRATGGLANVDAGASTPSDRDTGPRTEAEVSAYFRSPEYRALPLDKQKEAKNLLRAKLQSGTKAG